MNAVRQQPKLSWTCLKHFPVFPCLSHKDGSRVCYIRSIDLHSTKQRKTPLSHMAWVKLCEKKKHGTLISCAIIMHKCKCRQAWRYKDIEKQERNDEGQQKKTHQCGTLIHSFDSLVLQIYSGYLCTKSSRVSLCATVTRGQPVISTSSS